MTSPICVMQLESWLVSEDTMSPVTGVTNTMTSFSLTAAPSFTKVCLGHRTGLREWYPAARRRPVIARARRRRPVWQISWPINLGLDRHQFVCIILSKWPPSRKYFGDGQEASDLEIQSAAPASRSCKWQLVWHPYSGPYQPAGTLHERAQQWVAI